jgi:hypothetical protein
LYKKANEIAILKSKVTDEHISNFGNPLVKDPSGKTLNQKLLDIDVNNPLITPEIENRLGGLTKSASQSKNLEI